MEPSDKIAESEIAVSPAATERYVKEYGNLYEEAQARVKAAMNKSIASLFTLPKQTRKKGEIVYGKIKTEILFIERCLDLLKPGGRMGIVLPEGIYNNPSLAHVREFTEDRAFLKAVVSLPQETFVSSGASVKCSLLFLQKYTDEQKQKFDETYAQAKTEIDAKYEGEIDAETTRLETAIAKAKEEKDTEGRKELQKELNAYLKAMDEKKTAESRQLLKERFDYPIFMYEAEKVGITATGQEDVNELYSTQKLQMHTQVTAIDNYNNFLSDPGPFLVELNEISEEESNKGFSVMPPTPRKGSFAIRWKDFERWDTFFYRIDFVEIERKLTHICTAQLGEVLNFGSRAWKKTACKNKEFRYVEISAVTKEGGITGTTLVKVSNAPSRATTLIKEGDIILSTTRPYLGAFAIVTKEYDDCVCSSGFSLALGMKNKNVDPEYLLLFLKSEAGLKQFERRMTGGLYPAIVQDELEKIKIPIVPLDVQKQIVKEVFEGRRRVLRELEEAKRKAEKELGSLDALVLGKSLRRSQ